MGKNLSKAMISSKERRYQKFLELKDLYAADLMIDDESKDEL